MCCLHMNSCSLAAAGFPDLNKPCNMLLYVITSGIKPLSWIS
ncbi:hypothetical protein HanPSC8_Chr07g0303751 [Helianthus annuus]|nr:hypothetical protein HanPSC8_Chr07g0303751 [Helianthus annuus]